MQSDRGTYSEGRCSTASRKSAAQCEVWKLGRGDTLLGLVDHIPGLLNAHTRPVILKQALLSPAEL